MFGPEARLQQEARDGFEEDAARRPHEMHVHLLGDEDLPAQQALVMQRAWRHGLARDPQLGAVRRGQERQELAGVASRRVGAVVVLVCQEPDGKGRGLLSGPVSATVPARRRARWANTRLWCLSIPPPFRKLSISRTRLLRGGLLPVTEWARYIVEATITVSLHVLLFHQASYLQDDWRRTVAEPAGRIIGAARVMEARGASQPNLLVNMLVMQRAASQLKRLARCSCPRSYRLFSPILPNPTPLPVFLRACSPDHCAQHRPLDSARAMAAWTRWAATLVVVLASALLYPIVVKIRRRSQKPRPGGIQVLSDPPDAKFQIVAVHGLGAHPDHTWTANSARVNAGRPEKVHLLRDLLKHDFPDARVLSFAHNSDWLIDAPVKTARQIGDRLLEQLKANQPAQRLPTIFIGHSFGGIIIKEALRKPGSREIMDDTCGIIFLGTPHQGSSVSVLGAVMAFLTGFLGSNATLLLSLKSHQDQLSDLADAFRTSMAQKEDRRQKEGRRQKAKIKSFYETKPTYLLGWLSIGLVVTRDSATVHADETIAIDTDHSGLNKCSGREAELYKQLEKAILDLQAPSLLDEADEWIRKKHYTPDRLKIERLSSDSLPMDQCYINLAIVEQTSKSAGRSGGDAAHPSSPFSLLARQKVETPDEKIQIELPVIFNPRKGPNGDTTAPRRLLIRGRAGVGKTTLCKKIVHDFHDLTCDAWSAWRELFDRILWVPLRNLKLEERRQAGYCFVNLFDHEYFSLPNVRPDLARALSDALETKNSRTVGTVDSQRSLAVDMEAGSSMGATWGATT
ncbi:hypothetical protein GQ53DRAFT_81806 [Thozetella sp. PMI_491]|nr:hypothetical protein GQ53DRAFT_81806 [Thozetella sp. PMI_491]